MSPFWAPFWSKIRSKMRSILIHFVDQFEPQKGSFWSHQNHLFWTNLVEKQIWFWTHFGSKKKFGGRKRKSKIQPEPEKKIKNPAGAGKEIENLDQNEAKNRPKTGFLSRFRLFLGRFSSIFGFSFPAPAGFLIFFSGLEISFSTQNGSKIKFLFRPILFFGLEDEVQVLEVFLKSHRNHRFWALFWTKMEAEMDPKWTHLGLIWDPKMGLIWVSFGLKMDTFLGPKWTPFWLQNGPKMGSF